MTPDQMDKEIRDRGLSAFLMSNPCNPTGTLIRDEELKGMVEVFRKRGATLITDEFYSWYDLEGPLGSAISAAEFVEDPNEDPIVLIDGLTKNWRCPVSGRGAASLPRAIADATTISPHRAGASAGSSAPRSS